MMDVQPRRGWSVWIVDWMLVLGVGLGIATGLGIVWSWLRTGTVSWLFVREGFFILGVVVLGWWAIRNWTSKPTVDDEQLRAGSNGDSGDEFELELELETGPFYRTRRLVHDRLGTGRTPSGDAGVDDSPSGPANGSSKRTIPAPGTDAALFMLGLLLLGLSLGIELIIW